MGLSDAQKKREGGETSTLGSKRENWKEPQMVCSICIRNRAPGQAYIGQWNQVGGDDVKSSGFGLSGWLQASSFKGVRKRTEGKAGSEDLRKRKRPSKTADSTITGCCE